MTAIETEFLNDTAENHWRKWKSRIVFFMVIIPGVSVILGCLVWSYIFYGKTVFSNAVAPIVAKAVVVQDENIFNNYTAEVETRDSLRTHGIVLGHIRYRAPILDAIR